MTDEPTRSPNKSRREGASRPGSRTPEELRRSRADARDVERTEAEVRPTRSGLPRVLLVLIGLGAGWLAITGMKELAEVIAPVFLAITLVIAAYPIKTFLHRKLHLPEMVGSIATGLAVVGVLVAFFWAIGWALARFVTEMPKYQEKFQTLYHQGLEQLGRFGVSEQQVNASLKDFNVGSLVDVAKGALGAGANGLQLLIVIATVLIFLMMDLTGLAERLDTVDKYHPNLAVALDMFANGVRRYWVITTVFGLIVAVLDWAVLAVMGVPLALVWAVLAFLTNYIPNIGFVIGVIPPALMALLAKGPVPALVVVIAYAVLNFVVQSVIQPRFAGDAVGVTPTVSFVSLLFWGWVWGLLGALIALPATLLFKALLIDTDPQSRWVNAFISNDVKKADPSRGRLGLRRRKSAGTAAR